MSFLHHMAVQRLCKNPFEDAEVAGITNYLDFGLQVHCRPFTHTSTLLQDEHALAAWLNSGSLWCLHGPSSPPRPACRGWSLTCMLCHGQIVSGLARGQRSARAGSTVSPTSMAEPDLNSIRLGAAWQARDILAICSYL